MADVTARQENYILMLAGEVQGETVRFLSQVKCIRLTQREVRGGMTKSEASAHIKELLELKNK